MNDLKWYVDEEHLGIAVLNEKHVKESGLMNFVFCMLIAGLAMGADPLCVLLNALPEKVHELARNLATGIYLLQEPMGIAAQMMFVEDRVAWIHEYASVDEDTGMTTWQIPDKMTGGMLWVTYVLCFAGAVVVQYGIQAPLGHRMTTLLDPVVSKAHEAGKDVYAGIAARLSTPDASAKADALPPSEDKSSTSAAEKA